MQKWISTALIALLISINFFSIQVSASEQYWGRVSVKLVEPNGDSYQGMQDESPFSEKSYFSLRQYSGQPISFSQGNINFDNSTQHKYHIIFEITERNNDGFVADINLFENQALKQKSGKLSVVSKKITTEKITGKLANKQSFRFLEDGKANVYLTVHIDKVFSDDEKQARLLKIKKR